MLNRFIFSASMIEYHKVNGEIIFISPEIFMVILIKYTIIK